MKKFMMLVVGIYVVAMVAGLYYRSSYTKSNLNDTGYLQTLEVVNWLSGDDFVIDEEESEEDAGGDDIVISYFDQDSGDKLGEETYDYQGDFVQTYEMSMEGEMIEVLKGSHIVLVVESEGEIKNLAANILQKVKVKDVIVGEKTLKDKKIDIISGREGMYVDGAYMALGSVVNFMNKGDEYLVFLDETPKEDLYRLRDLPGVAYFNLKETINVVVPSEEVMEYKDVKDNEFFVTDDVALEKILEIKEQLLYEYLGENK